MIRTVPTIRSHSLFHIVQQRLTHVLSQASSLNDYFVPHGTQKKNVV